MKNILATVIILFLIGGAGALKSTQDIKDLRTALKAGVPVIVKLGADWCSPCRAMKPIIKQLAEEQNGKAVFLDLNIEEYRALAREFKVMLIPTVIFYDKHGKPRSQHVGFMSKEELLKEIIRLELNK